MKKTIFLLNFILLIVSSLNAQATDETTPQPAFKKANGKSIVVGNAIQKFNTTDFMVRFRDFKDQMEADARDFITHQNKYSVKDVRRVQMSYDKTAAKFNQIMLEIKEDFKDKDKIKVVNQYPTMYSDALKGKIDGLEDFYKANFQQTLSEVTEKDGSALLLVLVDLIKAAGELSQHFKALKYEKEFMNDQYLQENLVKPNKLPSWTEISASTTIIPKEENNNNNSNNGNGGDNKSNNNDEMNGNIKIIPTNTTDAQSGLEVEGESTIQQQNKPNTNKKPVLKPANTEGVKKTIKQNK